MSFGFHRAEILGALASVIMIWLLTGVLLYEAILRLMDPSDVDGRLMFFIACGGLVVNLVIGYVLHQSGHGHSHGGLPTAPGHGHSHGHGDHGHSHGHSHSHGHGHGHSHGHSSSHSDNTSCDSDGDGSDESTPLTTKPLDSSLLHAEARSPPAARSHKKKFMDANQNINVRAALLHVIGDAVQSIGVMVAAALIWYNPDWKIADPICTFLFSIIVVFTTVRLMKESMHVLMEGVPANIEVENLQARLSDVPDVIGLHDLHVWSLSAGQPALTVHITCRDGCTATVLCQATAVCREFSITHTTIQVEDETNKPLCVPDPVCV